VPVGIYLMKGGASTLKNDGGHNIAFSLLLIGGHLAASELMHKQAGAAISQSLGVAACVAIFLVMQAVLSSVRGKEDDP